MIISTRVVVDMETLEVLARDCYEYAGPLDLCGEKNKMRQITAGQATSNAANSATDRNTETNATGQVQNLANQLMSTKAGQLSPWSSANYASNLDNIANTYNQQRQMGFKALGQSGFGSSPGATASMMNTAGQNQGVAQTGAYRNALNDTLSQNLTGAGLEQGISGQYGGQSQNESGQAVNDASTRINEGSTAGDIAGGIGAIAAPIIKGFAGIGNPAAAAQGGGTSPMSMPGPWSTGQMPTTGTYGFGGLTRPSARVANTGVGTY